MRGNRREYTALHDHRRSIPAHAGEPNAGYRPCVPVEVYPRACGGTVADRLTNEMQDGLSPRMRGNHRRPVGNRRAEGSIPAYAGEPAERPLDGKSHGVYPRACGGTSPPTLRPRRLRGLSPRMRGNRGPARRPSAPRRSIPAHAGEPQRRRIMHAATEVYPRACGGTSIGSAATTL